MTAMAPPRPGARPGKDRFGRLVRAEWTKFRTVRGWVAGIMLCPLLVVALGFLYSHVTCSDAGSGGGAGHPAACPAPPIGPGGEAVTDTFYFAHKALAGDGTITVRMTSLTGEYSPDGRRVPASGAPGSGLRHGVQPWSKAGIMVSASTAPGSAYAAMLVTGGNGVRMQWNYTGDSPGVPGAVSASSPRWLRLSRSGNTVTGYDSPDGTHWTEVNRVVLSGLPPTAQVGLFATSPAYQKIVPVGSASYASGPSRATGTFDHVHLAFAGAGGTWTRTGIGGAGVRDPNTFAPGPESFTRSGGRLTVTGSGDIAPDQPEAPQGTGIESEPALQFGLPVGLIPVIIVAALFVTAEYRRGLIRVTFAASPRRGRVLVAKAVLIGLVTFAAGLLGAGIALTLGIHLLRGGGNFVLGTTAPTEIRMVAGAAAMLGVTAVLALALGTLARRGVTAVTVVITLIFLPALLATLPGLLPPVAQEWLLRVTPPAAIAVVQDIPAYHQVIAQTQPPDGYFPLSWWAGLGVLCAWAAIALAGAAYALRRRDV